MPRYLDTGDGQASECLGEWLNANLVSGIRRFRGQFGYFEISALLPYKQVLVEAVQQGHAVRFVLGANDGGLRAVDVRGVLDLIQNSTSGSLVVVRYDNALFHPKTIHLIRQDSSEVAIVGSANFTARGLGRNVEAMIELDTREGDDKTVVQSVANAIDRWSSIVSDGVFPIRSDQDVTQLVATGVIDVPQIRQPTTSIKLRRSGQSTLGRRRPLWTPPASPQIISTHLPRPTKRVPPSGKVSTNAVQRMQWCKQLSKSDAQQVTQTTNPTGKFRLSKAGFDIDLARYFRYDMFGAEQWSTILRNGKSYEVAEVEFEVMVRGNAMGHLTLTVDHASHRIAGQNNVPTVLAWGLRLNQMLRATNYVGDWVVIDRDMQGRYQLLIQSAKPSWAP